MIVLQCSIFRFGQLFEGVACDDGEPTMMRRSHRYEFFDAKVLHDNRSRWQRF